MGMQRKFALAAQNRQKCQFMLRQFVQNHEAARICARLPWARAAVSGEKAGKSTVIPQKSLYKRKKVCYPICAGALRRSPLPQNRENAAFHRGIPPARILACGQMI